MESVHHRVSKGVALTTAVEYNTERVDVFIKRDYRRRAEYVNHRIRRISIIFFWHVEIKVNLLKRKLSNLGGLTEHLLQIKDSQRKGFDKLGFGSYKSITQYHFVNREGFVLNEAEMRETLFPVVAPLYAYFPECIH